ncbi:MAG: hypothetical protein ACI37T_00965 [Candidatus Gastranaerophilaceae bacterium]
MFNSQKRHNSCVRVLEFLKLLTQDDICLNNIYEKSQEKFKNIEATETFLKYINTLYISGLKVKKVGKKYSLCNSISTVSFSRHEFDLLLQIYNNFNNCCISSDKEDFDLFFTNIFKFLHLEDKAVFLKKITNSRMNTKQKIFAQKTQYYQKLVSLKQELKIKYNNETFIVEPKDIKIENENIYLIVYKPQDASIMKILTDNLQKIEILPVKVKSSGITETVVFEVYDRLAFNYRLRDCERIQTFSDNKKVIINCGEDRKQLIRRLLKYGENCKVLLPKTFQAEFLKSLTVIADKLNGVKNEENSIDSD